MSNREPADLLTSRPADLQACGRADLRACGPADALQTPHGSIALPAFLPDATMGVVRAVDSADLEAAAVQAVVMNVFHLMQKPGSSTIAALGGLHRMAAWPHPIVTDSGGFQAYSLIRQNPKVGAIGESGIRYRPDGTGRPFLLTPEKSVQLQMAYGADVVICLDDCTHVDAAQAEQEAAVARTVRWARRCRQEFDRQTSLRSLAESARPLLFAVVQGGADTALRRRCADELLEIGFDGYGYGGFPLDAGGNLLEDLLAFTRSTIPQELPMHALGVGHPESVAACARMGYRLFDSALPTRDARSGRLYRLNGSLDDTRGGGWFSTVYVDDDRYVKAAGPISPGCDCHACRCYSLGYVRHLHKCGDSLFLRLATIHNLRFMTRLMESLCPCG
jgi:queuine tRNA-ribosyltransferase